jgi:glycine betaine/proline transport system permease protein
MESPNKNKQKLMQARDTQRMTNHDTPSPDSRRDKLRDFARETGEQIRDFFFLAVKQIRGFIFSFANLRFFLIMAVLFIATAFLVNVTGNEDLREETIRDFSNETDDLIDDFDDMVDDVESETDDLADDITEDADDDGIPDAADEAVLQTFIADALDDDLGDFVSRVTLVHVDGTGVMMEATEDGDPSWMVTDEIGEANTALDMEMVQSVRESEDEAWWLLPSNDLQFAMPFEWEAELRDGRPTTSVFVMTVTHETLQALLLDSADSEDLYADTEVGYALLVTPETETIAEYGREDVASDNLTQLFARLEESTPNEYDVYTFDSHTFIDQESLIVTYESDELDGWRIVGSIPTEEIPTVGLMDSSEDLFAFSELGGLLSEYVEEGVDYLNQDLAWFFQDLRSPIEVVISSIENQLLETSWEIIIIAIAATAWLVSGRRIAYIATLSMFGIGLIGLWEETMTTLAMLLTSMAFCIIIGIPLGILSARSDRLNGIVRSVLDAMQTIHPFVYLVPIVVLFGIGKVPGTIATIIFALPPMVRLTNLGIRQVPEDVVEAARSFGSNDFQLLRDVQLPLALPSIMAGVNQTLMLSLSMVVIVALIAGGGLGEQIYRAIGRADTGRAVVAGVAVLLLAIAVDRISQGKMGEVRRTEEE